MLRTGCAALLMMGVWASAAESSAASAEPGLTVTAGASAWSGDFGTGVDTDISAAIFNATFDLPGVTLGASLPWMQLKGPSAVFVGIGASPLFVSPTVSPVTKRDGWGDLTLSAAAPLLKGDQGGLDLEATGRVKIPTASSRSGVSTGETDYSLGLAASKPMGTIVPSLSVAYRWFGDNAAWDLKNGVAASASVGIPLPRSLTAVVSYDYARGATRFIDDSHEAVFGLSAPVADSRLRWTAFIAKGLSDGAADLSGGISLGLRL